MISFLSCLLSFSALLVSARESYAPVSVLPHKRALMTCQQTYGSSSQKCGSDDSTFCFDSRLGQTCCPRDGGYCGKGTYCAPVAGYCCEAGEDLSTCARNAGFVLPNSSPSPAVKGLPGASSSAIFDPAVSVTPFLGVQPKTTTTLTPCAADETAVPISNVTAPVPTFNSSNTTIPPLVQVSVADKEDRVALGIAVACLASVFIAFL
ncbi:hypothetical protein F4780DRAFT_212531 [Xylariomycetidae sp. FL0641]|nr:hypothetical protein F4780DRAFT_212531 [Xylariomycetidae sp. FL0641]